LIDLYNKICELPARNDIKILLRKCVYCILVDDEAHEEVLFLNEVRKLMNEIKGTCNFDHMEIISVIDEIYKFAIDKKISEKIQVNPEPLKIHEDLLSLFEVQYPFLQEMYGEEDFEGEDECREDREESDEEEENEESCEYSSPNFPVWRPYENH